MDDLNVDSQFGESIGGHFICGAVCCINDDLHPFHRQITRERVLQKNNVTPEGIFHAVGPAHILGLRYHLRELPAQDKVFDNLLLLIGQFETIAPKDLDTVILVWVVRGGNYDACVGAHALRYESNAWGR